MKILPDLSIPGRVKPYIMAHRGNRRLCPENTRAAFVQALKDGADILETDLHLSADGEFVCIHDKTVNRTTNGTGPIREMTVSRLKGLKASNGFRGFENEEIPLLKEFLGLIPKDVAVALELKCDDFLNPEICRKLWQELYKTGLEKRAIVISFSLPRILSMKKAVPQIPGGWISLFRPWPRPGIPLLGPFWPLLLMNPLFIFAAHLRGQLICPLDPNPDKRFPLYVKLRCDAVLTDDPASTQKVKTACLSNKKLK